MVNVQFYDYCYLVKLGLLVQSLHLILMILYCCCCRPSLCCPDFACDVECWWGEYEDGATPRWGYFCGRCFWSVGWFCMPWVVEVGLVVYNFALWSGVDLL